MFRCLVSLWRKSAFLFALVAAAYCSMGQYAMAQAPVIPDIDADMSDVITATGTAIGPIIKTCLLLAAAVLIVRIAWKWLRRGANA